MRKNKSTALILSSILVFGGVTASLVSCSNDEVVVDRYAITTQIDNSKDITVKYSVDKGAVGETVKGTLNYDETKFKIVSVKEITGINIHLIDGKHFQFIMPNRDITIKITSERIFNTANLLETLQAVKDARNYTVQTTIETKNDVADAICYFTENAYMKELSQYDLETGELVEQGTSISGEINHEDGVYQYIYEPKQEKFYTSKVLYSSVKNGYKSFWDPKHDVTGLHELTLNYVRETDETYTFKPAEIGNINAVFENTFIAYDTVKSFNPIITASVNPKNHLQFDIAMAGYGKITQEVLLINETSIPLVEDFLANGGGPLKAELTVDQEKTLEAVKLDNYIQDLPDYKNAAGVKIPRGKIYYTPKYMYTDYTDEFIAEAEKEKVEIHDEGYLQDGNDVVKFDVLDTTEGPEIKLVEISRVKNTTVPVAQKYLSTIKYFDIYKYAQPVSYPVEGGSIAYDEISDPQIVHDFTLKALRLDPENFNHLMMLDAVQTCGVQPLNEGQIGFLCFAILRDPDSNKMQASLFGATYNGFGKAKVQLMEDYFAK